MTVRHAGSFGLDYIQLHGNESPDYCAGLRREGFRVIKAFSIAGPEDFIRIPDYDDVCDYYLFDTGSGVRGGSGRQFDWSLLECYRQSVPFFLSGGIGEESARKILELRHPCLAGVDVNSRFETSPGVKDAAGLGRFIRSLR